MPARVTVQLADRGNQMRRVVDRDDTRVVNQLLEDDDVVGRLKDLEVAVVPGQQVRHTIRDAPIQQAAALVTVRPPPTGRGWVRRRSLASTVTGGMRPFGGSTIRRCPVVELTLDQPERVVVPPNSLPELENRAFIIKINRQCQVLAGFGL